MNSNIWKTSLIKATTISQFNCAFSIVSLNWFTHSQPQTQTQSEQKLQELFVKHKNKLSHSTK